MAICSGFVKDFPIYRLSYVSSAVSTIGEPEMFDIARSAQRNNRANDISGILLFCAGEILQTLEGSEEEVEATFRRVSRDPRHSSITIVATMRAQHRRFPSWSMGCFQLRPEDLPSGFLFEHSAAGTRLRHDAFARIDDLLRTFDREQFNDGSNDGMAKLIAA